MSKFVEELLNNSKKLEEELSLPNNFLNNLKDEDDWSFIIKIHALFEGALSYLLSSQPGLERCEDIFSYLEISNKKIGKLAFTKSLGVLESNDRRFISSLSELRNKLVHDVKNVSFNLDDNFLLLPISEKRKYIKSFCYVLIDSDTDLERLDDISFRVEGKHTRFIWDSSIYLLSKIYMSIDKSRVISELNELRDKYIDVHMDILK